MPKNRVNRLDLEANRGIVTTNSDDPGAEFLNRLTNIYPAAGQFCSRRVWDTPLVEEPETIEYDDDFVPPATPSAHDVRSMFHQQISDQQKKTPY